MRIPKLSTLIRTLKAVCKVIEVARPVIRPFVPENKRTDFDNALDAIMDACDVIRAIEYADQNPATNAPWG